MAGMLLIKYSEIGVKGKNRYVFEDMLVRNIKSALKPLDHPCDVRKADGRVYISYEEEDYEEALEALSKVFGIAWICPVTQIRPVGIEELKEQVVQFVRDTYFSKGEPEPFSFKVNCRRAEKSYPLNSMEVNMLAGEAVLEAFPQLTVDVHHPDVMLNIEIRPKDINLYSVSIEGLNGMPVGSSGKAMLLLSGGIDSPVAGYLISKRGVSLDAVYFHAPPYTSERAKQKVVDLAKIISAYTGPVKLHIVNFTEIQMKIYEVCPHDELTIIMRRYMMKIAQELAEKEGCLGLVTGESIGQVASQTMQSMLVTNEVCHLPVYRPLCAFDKLDIVAISEKIGAYETSILPYEDCCTIFVAKHPVTKPKLDRILRSERKLEGVMKELYQKAMETVEVIEI
ncbi:MAG: tRNA 4-thiouridine(8) synthase ThiI [Parasporobacterium sp.]|nr:tRNA 4-thiouridine(8) synthase ThiI [Parasporobacterium sp.]